MSSNLPFSMHGAAAAAAAAVKLFIQEGCLRSCRLSLLLRHNFSNKHTAPSSNSILTKQTFSIFGDMFPNIWYGIGLVNLCHSSMKIKFIFKEKRCKFKQFLTWVLMLNGWNCSCLFLYSVTLHIMQRALSFSLSLFPFV